GELGRHGLVRGGGDAADVRQRDGAQGGAAVQELHAARRLYAVDRRCHGGGERHRGAERRRRCRRRLGDGRAGRRPGHGQGERLRGVAGGAVVGGEVQRVRAGGTCHRGPAQHAGAGVERDAGGQGVAAVLAHGGGRVTAGGYRERARRQDRERGAV